MTEYAVRLQNGADTAPRVRQVDSLPLQHAGALNARTGVRPDGGAEVTAVDGTMQVQVTAFSGWINGEAANQGGWAFINDATKTLTVEDGDATLGRTDTVAAVVYEDAFDGSGETKAELVIVKGTPGAGAPALPASAMPLRDLDVPAGVSAGTGGLAASNVGSDRRTWLSAGVVPVAGAAERDALGALGGQAVWRKDTKTLEVYDGATWRTYGEAHSIPAYGERSGNTNSSGEITVTHGLGVTPTCIQLTGHTGPGAPIIRVKGSPTSNTFDAEVRDNTGSQFNGAVTFYWTAYPPA